MTPEPEQPLGLDLPAAAWGDAAAGEATRIRGGGSFHLSGSPGRRHPGPKHRRRRPVRSTLLRGGLTLLGIVLLWGGLALTGYAAGWQSHKDAAQTKLIAGETAMAKHVARQLAHKGGGTTTCVVTAPQNGQLAGLLRIPALNLTAPVEEGTTDAELNVAVGHDASSVWPGAAGTSVLLAHDVSYFVHLNALKPGDQIIYQTACTTVTYTVSGQQVVAQGTPVPSSSTPTLVLDTCYPPNALFFTTQRLLVSATETGAARPSSGSGIQVPSGDQVSYTVPAPASLVAQGLTLQQNEAPMGTMTLSGDTSPSWEQSPGPLALEAAALEDYFGGIDAAEQLRPTWWTPISLPGVATPGPLEGATISGHDAPLDVDIQSSNGVATSVTLTTTISITGGDAPGAYQETVTTQVSGDTVRISGWTMTPAPTTST